ncbi:MAG: M20 family metallopeptidase, partial [Endomicrobiia bacterium]
CAILLKRKYPHSINDTAIKFIFQPNEESAGGAQTMIKEGALKNPDVDYILGIHVNPQLPPNTIGIKYGEMMASVDKFEVEIYGGGGHAAYPHNGKDTILTASEIILSLQTLVSREIDPVEPVVISVCTIQGGTRFNVLSEKVIFTGTVRTLNEKLHKKMPELIEKIIKEKTKAKKLKYNFKYDILGYPLYNDKNLTDICIKSAEKIVGKEKIIILEKPSMGGEDFSEYLRFVPGCFLYIGSKIKNKNIVWHHPEFDIDEKVLLTGSKVLAQIVEDITSELEGGEIKRC